MMKHHNLATTIVALVLPCASCFAAPYVWQPISGDRAIALVRAFEGNPSLAVTIERVNPPWSRGQPSDANYWLRAGDQGYFVSVLTSDTVCRTEVSFDRGGDLAAKSAFYGRPYDPLALAPLAISQSAAQAIAQSFMESHFPAPARLNSVTVHPHAAWKVNDTDPDWTDYYEFCFAEVYTNGASGPAISYVDVDTIRSRVITYSGVNYPLNRDPVAQISAAQALSLAIAASGVTQGVGDALLGAGVAGPDALGFESFHYEVAFHGILPGRSEPTDFRAAVDGDTGEVLMVTRMHGVPRPGKPLAKPMPPPPWAIHPKPTSPKLVMDGRPVRLAVPPVMIGGRPYLFIGYLAYGNRSAKTGGRPGGGITVDGASRHLSFTLGSRQCHINGKARTLAAAPAILGGVTYVPLEAATGVLPFGVRYDAPNRTIYLVSRTRSAATARRR